MLVAGFVVLANPAPLSAINTCDTICHCEVSCATECTHAGWEGVWPDREWVIWAANCGEYGLCTSTCPDPTLPCQSCTHTVNGTSGGDTLYGNANRECIYGQGGNDTIDGGAGDDRIYCGAGTDTAYGNSGNDCLWGEDDNDHLDGQSGTDECNGGPGTDTCYCETNLSCP
jgi:hypothetical protein